MHRQGYTESERERVTETQRENKREGETDLWIEVHGRGRDGRARAVGTGLDVIGSARVAGDVGDGSLASAQCPEAAHLVAHTAARDVDARPEQVIRRVVDGVKHVHLGARAGVCVCRLGGVSF